MCERRLFDGPLICVRADTHDPNARGGHQYESTSVSDGKHDDLGNGD